MPSPQAHETALIELGKRRAQLLSDPDADQEELATLTGQLQREVCLAINAGISERRAAALIGVSRTTISSWRTQALRDSDPATMSREELLDALTRLYGERVAAQTTAARAAKRITFLLHAADKLGIKEMEIVRTTGIPRSNVRGWKGSREWN